MRHEEISAMDAMWMVLSMIFIGSIIGLVFHHWPLPVNNSVFISSKEGVSK